MLSMVIVDLGIKINAVYNQRHILNNKVKEHSQVIYTEGKWLSSKILLLQIKLRSICSGNQPFYLDLSVVWNGLLLGRILVPLTKVFWVF